MMKMVMKIMMEMMMKMMKMLMKIKMMMKMMRMKMKMKMCVYIYIYIYICDCLFFHYVCCSPFLWLLLVCSLCVHFFFFRTSLERVFDLSRYVCDMLGICLTYVWDMLRTSLEAQHAQNRSFLKLNITAWGAPIDQNPALWCGRFVKI